MVRGNLGRFSSLCPQNSLNFLLNQETDVDSVQGSKCPLKRAIKEKNPPKIELPDD